MLTAKAERLWDPYGKVAAEYVRHMQSRVTVFQSTAKVGCEERGQAPNV